MSALSTRELRVTFGEVTALDGVDLDVGHGRLVGLIGPNGAGKTTFIDAVTGFVPATGTVRLHGRSLPAAAYRRARAGLARTWQALELFNDLTVRENVQVAASPGGLGGLLPDLLIPRRRVDWSRADAALDDTGLAEFADTMPGRLSQGRRKLVDLARALAGGAQVLCLDEPAAGLDTAESRALGVRLRVLAERGVSMLLVDHDMGLVLGVCDEIYVLEHGRLIARGTPAEIRGDTRVVAAYLGTGPTPPQEAGT
jgi:branched-chain amino acid transport system ATP-binding protein